MPTTKEIKDAMAGAGLQEVQKNKFTQLNADEGFCRGACMDWMRRVLQGRLAYEYERTGGKGARREARMRDIHATLMGRVIAAAAETESDINARAARLRARVNEINELDGQAWQDAAAAYQLDQSALNQDTRAYSAMSDKGPMASGCAKLSGELDARRGKPGAQRTFAKMTPATGSAPMHLGTSEKVRETIRQGHSRARRELGLHVHLQTANGYRPLCQRGPRTQRERAVRSQLRHVRGARRGRGHQGV